MTQWTQCWPENQRVTGSIPSQGTCQKKKKKGTLSVWEDEKVLEMDGGDGDTTMQNV